MDNQALAALISGLQSSLTVTPGVSTSEFWVSLIFHQVPAILALALGASNPVCMVVSAVCALSSAVYSASRSYVKTNTAQAAASAIQAAADAVTAAANAAKPAALLALLALAGTLCACTTAQVQTASADTAKALAVACHAARQAVTTCDNLGIKDAPAVATPAAPAAQ